jgi:hypothetical protein
MNEITQILSAIEQGDTRGADQLFPLVSDTSRRFCGENPGQNPHVGISVFFFGEKLQRNSPLIAEAEKARRIYEVLHDHGNCPR